MKKRDLDDIVEVLKGRAFTFAHITQDAIIKETRLKIDMNDEEKQNGYKDPLAAIKAAEVLVDHHAVAYRIEAVGEHFYVVPLTDKAQGVICEVIYPSERQEQRKIEEGMALARGWECPACGTGLAPTEKRCPCVNFKKAPSK